MCKIYDRIWEQKIEWDEILPESIQRSWVQFCEELKFLELLSIPRKVFLGGYSDIQIHGFCDASESAYGACIYIRCTDADNQPRTQLLCSKSRVAPVKKVSLPRLELCSAVLLSRLLNKVVIFIEVSLQHVYLVVGFNSRSGMYQFFISTVENIRSKSGGRNS